MRQALLAALAAFAGTLTMGEALAQQTYADPFSYCAAEGTVDTPDTPYLGPATPASVVAGLRQAAELGNAMPDTELASQTFWRCMGSTVYACFVGANLPCWEKADTNRTPSSAMTDFCRQHPGMDTVPASITGRATIYQWQCVGDQAVESGTVFTADAAGYISEFWYPIHTPN